MRDFAEGHGPSRLHRDFPEHDLAKLAQQLAHEIGFAHGYAARGDDRVGIGGGSLERALQAGRVIAHHAHVDDVAVEARQHAVERVAVAVVHFARLQHRTDRGQFVAGREKRHAQAPPHRHLGQAERGDQSQLGRTYRLPGPDHGFARGEILAREAAVLAAFLAGGDAHPLALDPDDFLDHDRVGALGHHRAGHDAHALAFAHAAVELPSGESAAGKAQHGLGLWREVGVAQGIAVHGRVVVRRHVQRGDDVLSEHASECRAQRKPFIGADRCEKSAHDRARLVHRERLRVVRVHATGDLLQRRHALGSALFSCASSGQVRDHSCQRFPDSRALSSSLVLILENASASSSNATSATRRVAYQASTLRPPALRKAAR